MFYQVIVESKEKVGKSQTNKTYYEYDILNEGCIINNLLVPYLLKEQVQFDGYFLNYTDILRISIKKTEKNSLDLVQYENDSLPAGVLFFTKRDAVIQYPKHCIDYTKEIFQKAKDLIDSPTIAPLIINKELKKIFIVHGQDDLAKIEVARFIERLSFEPIILHEQVNMGMTIIEKIEHYSDVDFGIVLYTPCDIGNQKDAKKMNPRARQNVVFEHGYLIGKLKRENVCALVRNTVETPNDISGVVYIPMDENKAWMLIIAKELKKAGYPVDLNKI